LFPHSFLFLLFLLKIPSNCLLLRFVFQTPPTTLNHLETTLTEHFPTTSQTDHHLSVKVCLVHQSNLPLHSAVYDIQSLTCHQSLLLNYLSSSPPSTINFIHNSLPHSHLTPLLLITLSLFLIPLLTPCSVSMSMFTHPIDISSTSSSSHTANLGVDNRKPTPLAHASSRLVCAPAHQSRLVCTPAHQSRLVCRPTPKQIGVQAHTPICCRVGWPARPILGPKHIFICV
jgi:hypothetical protein